MATLSARVLPPVLALGPALAWLVPALGAAVQKPEPLPAPSVHFVVEPRADASTAWVLTVRNDGPVPLRLVADARLLRLFVTPAAPSAGPSAKGKKPVTIECVLPASMRDDGRTLVLSPGARYLESFDPRLFCLDHPVAPGASVSARLGFAPGAKLAPPFVLVPAGSGSVTLASAKELAAPTWTVAPVASASGSASAKAFRPLSASAGTARSAIDAFAADVTLTVKNVSSQVVHVYARPQLVDAVVVGPRGFPVHCNGAIAQPAPIADFVVGLGAGQTWSATVPLAGLCPAHTFDVPGLYLITPILHAPALPATKYKNAFAGDVVAEAPQLLRIETGKKSFHDVPPIAVSASASK